MPGDDENGENENQENEGGEAANHKKEGDEKKEKDGEPIFWFDYSSYKAYKLSPDGEKLVASGHVMDPNGFAKFTFEDGTHWVSEVPFLAYEEEVASRLACKPKAMKPRKNKKNKAKGKKKKTTKDKKQQKDKERKVMKKPAASKIAKEKNNALSKVYHRAVAVCKKDCKKRCVEYVHEDAKKYARQMTKCAT